MDKTWMNAEARYKANEDDDISDLPCEELRYFPIKKRLQRLFLNPKTARLMRWHDEDREKDGLLRHPADSPIWQDFDKKHPKFAADSRNIDDLLDLFVNGDGTYDASTREFFKLRTAVLWNITDFPSLGYTSGYVKSSEAACPYCDYHTCSHNGSNSRLHSQSPREEHIDDEAHDEAEFEDEAQFKEDASADNHCEEHDYLLLSTGNSRRC